eukprot:scaffold4841_cov132-Cylindrotheca_fusiformis.AAC.4
MAAFLHRNRRLRIGIFHLRIIVGHFSGWRAALPTFTVLAHVVPGECGKCLCTQIPDLESQVVNFQNQNRKAWIEQRKDEMERLAQEKVRQKQEEAKRLDYLVRAIRIEELPLVKAQYEEMIRTDRAQYEQEIEKAQRAKVQWDSDKRDKESLSVHSVFDWMEEFESRVLASRQLNHKALCADADAIAEMEAKKAKIERARKRKQNEARRLSEEEAKRRQEEEQRRNKEEARREREAKEEERRREVARMAEDRERNDRQADRGQRSLRALDYVPPSRRGQGAGEQDSRFGGGVAFNMMIPSKTFEIKVAFIGNVSAGKTTIINALFRDQFGEVSMKRTTAGVHEFAVCSSTDWALASDKEPHESQSILKEITEDNDALRKNNRMAVKRFEIELKEELCEMQKDTRLVIVDIPGINEAGARSKYRRYVEAKWNTFDCVVVVMDGRQGVNTEEQVSVLRFIKQNDSKREIPLLILFNKVDDPDDDEQAELVVEAREYVKNMFEMQDSEKNDEKSREGENRGSISPWFIPISGITAFIFRCCSNMSFEKFRHFDEKLIAKLGREHIGKLKWRKLSKEEQFMQAHTAVTDRNGYQQGIEGSNFDCFLKALSVAIGGESTQRRLIKKKIDESMLLLPSSGLVDKLDSILNMLTKLDPDKSNHLESLSSLFWRNYKSLENESIDELLSSPTAIHVLADAADELISYFKLAGNAGWKDEQALVCKSLKGLVRRQISTILQNHEGGIWARVDSIVRQKMHSLEGSMPKLPHALLAAL